MKKDNINVASENKSREIASAIDDRLGIQHAVNRFKYWLKLVAWTLTQEKKKKKVKSYT